MLNSNGEHRHVRIGIVSMLAFDSKHGIFNYFFNITDDEELQSLNIVLEYFQLANIKNKDD